MTSSYFRSPILALALGALYTSPAFAATNQFRGVNWADPRDNFQAGVIYVSGLSMSDTYASASATADGVVGQFVTKLGTNSVRLPINEATVSEFWNTYTGAIDAALTKGSVILCYWSTAGSKVRDTTKFWAMWATVTAKYGNNPNVYFEVFNEPIAYAKNDIANLYADWLTRYGSVPRSRVILDGTGYAQNVPDIAADSRFDGCPLAVHEYSMFEDSSWTSESQWVSHFKAEVGSYADRTVCTEWGGPMSTGSKNGVMYGPQDYDSPPGSYFVAYVRAVTGQLRAWNMGSFYWAGLKDGDWYSMTTKSGNGATTTLSVANQSGLNRLKYSWTPSAAGGTESAGAGSGGASSGAGGGGFGGTAGGVHAGGSAGTAGIGPGASDGGAAEASGGVATGAGGGGSIGTGDGTNEAAGSAPIDVGAAGSNNGAAGGGTTAAEAAHDSSGCSCAIANTRRDSPMLPGLLALLWCAGSRRRGRAARDRA